MGTFATDWTDRASHYVLFNDTLGSLTFGKTNWEDLADVESLIAGDFIRKDGGITDDFVIRDNGSTWNVSFTPIPEPGTAALSLLAFVALLSRRSRR